MGWKGGGMWVWDGGAVEGEEGEEGFVRSWIAGM